MRSDVVIIGGGVMGTAAAGCLRQSAAPPEVVVLEPDPAYTNAASPRASGGIRQLFSCPENIAMSQYTHRVIGDWRDYVAGTSDAEVPGLGFVRNGYLFISGNEVRARLAESAQTQRARGVDARWLSAAQLADRYPLIRTDDLAGAVYSPADGWLDPSSFLAGLRQRAQRLGARFLAERAVEFDTSGKRVTAVRTDSGARLEAEAVINAAGCWAPELAGRLGWKLPVEPMRRFAHYVESPIGAQELPFVKDAGHLAVRPEGAGLHVGVVSHTEPGGFNFTLSGAAEHFHARVWPALAHRFPALDRLRLKSSATGLYDQNRFDGNMIIGCWPGQLSNFYIACGFSGHGLMHAPAVGRALAELVLHGAYQTIDLRRLEYQRIADGKPYRETGII
jgi:FAD-dependent oxidoreductase domain-containing protein 1